MSMSLCSPFKFGICDIYNMFYAVLMQYFTKKLFLHLSRFYPARLFDYR